MEEIWVYLKSKKKTIAIIFLSLLFVILLVYPFYFFKKAPAANKSNKITCEVSGAVKKPGVFNLDNQSRVADALKLAGGLTGDADQDFLASMLNQARLVEDGEKIFIPKKQIATAQNTGTATTQTTTSSDSQTTQSSASSGQVAAGAIVNINSGSLSELDSLPGIGPAYAQRIIDYRTQNGNFTSIDQIQEIKGIGPKTFEKLKDLITI